MAYGKTGYPIGYLERDRKKRGYDLTRNLLIFLVELDGIEPSAS